MQLARFLNSVFKKDGFILVDANSKNYIIGNPKSENPIKLRILNKNLHYKLLFHPDLYFGEAYMNGEITIENGTLTDFLDLSLMNFGRGNLNFFSYLINKFRGSYRYLTNFNFIKKSKSNVSHHYDISEDLYNLFLDPKRQYSCAYFKNETDSLETAQNNKIQHIIKKLNIKPNQKVLDIGCGWGSLAIDIAKSANCEVTGITLSENQFATASKRAQEEGLSEKVSFQIQDYRNEIYKYDRIVSVGMFEHVGIKYFREYLKKTYKLLKENGVFLLHTIGQRGIPTATSPWIRKYIFPGGYIPSLSDIVNETQKLNINITDIEILRMHYAHTLSHWYKNVQKNKDKIIDMFDTRFYRMWEFYLLASKYSFVNMGNIVFQIQIAKNINNLPLTRNYMYN